MESTPHIRLLAVARWQCLTNSLKGNDRAWMDLAAKIFVVVLGTAVTLGAGLGIGALVYSDSKIGRGNLLGAMLSVIFWAWQFMPIITAAGIRIDFREIARYPISFPRFCLLELASGLLDPVTAMCLTWLVSLWIGFSLARPSLALRAALLLPVLALTALLINRLLFDFLERLLSTRKGRTRFFATLFVISTGYQLVMVQGLQALSRLRSMLGFFKYLPAGFAASGITGSLARGLAGLCAYCIVVALPLLLLYRRKYQGEVFSDGRAKAPVDAAKPGWTIPGLSGAAGAMLEKEIRYILSQPMGLVTIFYGPVIALFAGLGVVRGKAFSPAAVFPFLAGWCVLTIGGRCYNYFSLDSTGFSRYLLAPVSMRQVIATKNLLNVLILLFNFSSMYFVLRFFITITAAKFIDTSAGFVAASLATLAAGNYFSVHSPFGVDPDKMRNVQFSGSAAIGIMLTQLSIVGTLVAVVYWKLQPALVFSVLSIAGVVAYWMSMERAAGYAESHAEEISRSLIVK